MTIITPTGVTGINSITSSGNSLSFQNASGASIDVSGLKVAADSMNVSGIVTASGIVVSAGSTSAPSISFSGSPTTGLYSPATNQFAIATNGNNGFQVESINATGGIYDNVSFSVATQETVPQDVQFSTDGSKMFILGADGDDVTEYTLSTPWDISSASYVTEFSVVSQDNVPRGMFFRADGEKLFIVGDENDTVYQYTLATPWSIATASYDSVSFSVASQDNAPLGVTFKPDGLTMYTSGNQNDSIYQYTLGTAWNVSTATFLQTFSVAAQETTPMEVVFSVDGTTMYVVGSLSDNITTYTLATPWDISTAVYVTEFSVAAQETNPTGLFIKPDGTKAYVVGTINDTVYQYTLLPTKVTLNGDANVALDLSVGRNLTVSNGRVLVGVTSAISTGGVLQLSGGITFPATAVAATDPNTLDDYEEGTFTPVIADATTGGTTSTGGTVDGRYLKIGKWVTCTINCYNFSTSGMTAGNNFYVRGLPFNVQTTGAVVRHIGAAVAERCNLSTNSMTFQVIENTSYGIFVQNGGSGASARTVIVSDFSSGNSYFRTTIAYETA